MTDARSKTETSLGKRKLNSPGVKRRLRTSTMLTLSMVQVRVAILRIFRIRGGHQRELLKETSRGNTRCLCQGF